MTTFVIDSEQKLPKETLKRLSELKDEDIVYDEDCPMLTPEMEKALSNAVAQRNRLKRAKEADIMVIPEVVQVIPHDNYIVEVFFQDDKVVHYDVSGLLEKGVFKALKDKEFYKNRCTVMNHTLAWDISGEHDPTNCIDIDPEMLYSLQQ